MSAQHTPGPRAKVPKALQAIVRAADLFDDHFPTDQISFRFEDNTFLTVADLRAVRDYFAAIAKATGSAS